MGTAAEEVGRVLVMKDLNNPSSRPNFIQKAKESHKGI